MSKLTKVIKWAEENNYQMIDRYSSSGYPAFEIIVDEVNSFKCETRDSTIYMSIHGQRGDIGGLYLTHIYKPKDGRFHRPYGFWKSSQNEMIAEMEITLSRYAVKN